VYAKQYSIFGVIRGSCKSARCIVFLNLRSRTDLAFSQLSKPVLPKSIFPLRTVQGAIFSFGSGDNCLV
jgi:hypothetical protein